jgi:elongation factor P
MKASDIRRGHVLIIEGAPCRVMDFQHRTPGNLRAFVQVRLRNLNSGNTFDTRLSATEFVDDARLDTKELQVLYRDANGVHVMDNDTYEQYTLDDEIVGDAGSWLESGMTFVAEWLNGRPYCDRAAVGGRDGNRRDRADHEDRHQDREHQAGQAQ